MTVIHLTASGRARQSCEDETREVAGTQRVVGVKASSWDSSALFKVRTVAPPPHQMSGSGTGDQPPDGRTRLGRGASLECEVGPHTARPDAQGHHAENTVARSTPFANRASIRRKWRAGDGKTSGRKSRSGSMVKMLSRLSCNRHRE